MGRTYDDRIVAFVDMLGTSDAVLKDFDGTFTTAVHKVVSALAGRDSSIYLTVPHVKTRKDVEIQFEKPLGRSGKMTILSDGIVMSFPAIECENELAMGSTSLPILRCLEAVFALQRGLLSVGLRTRGGICTGKLIHTNNFVFGEGIVKAYRLESRVAVFPRTVIDEEVVDLLLTERTPDIVLFENRIAHLVRIDHDHKYFVDYLGYPLLGGTSLGDKIRDIYTQTVDDIRSAIDPKLIAKLQWLKDYIVRSGEELGDSEFIVENNSNCAFRKKFKRTSEDLISYAKSLDQRKH